MTDSPDGSATDQGLASTRPPREFDLVNSWVLDSTRELAGLRQGVLAELSRATGTPLAELDGVATAMVLIATELATNAIKHGLPPAIVRLLHADGVYLLDVADHDTSSIPYLAGTRPDGQGGFGLQIARRLAVEVGWYTADTAKHVWALLPDAPR